MNKAAQSLGKMGKGVPKTLTAKERRRRAKSLAEARKLRWVRRQNPTGQPRAVSARSVGPGCCVSESDRK